MHENVGEPWWKSAVIYQIYPRSFCDSSGNGVGDLEGIRRQLDHLVDLGVDAIWLSPFYVSPMADFGYDVADYCNVDPLFGTLEDFDRLLTSCHERDLRVLIDWVPNHTSDQHPWFQASRSSRDDPKRDWYIWRDPKPNGDPPNNWIAAFTGESAWTFDEATGQYYLHLFLPEQPDLNWRNPRVEAAMHDTLRFWLDRGVDGFRMDVIHLLGKDPELRDWPLDSAGQPRGAHDYEYTHELIRRLRRLVDSHPGERIMVGEVYLISTRRIAQYYGAGDELHLAFNFPALYAPWETAAWRYRIDRVVEEMDPRDAWPSWVLSNHDNPRHRTRYDSEARARAAAILLLTLRGTPFLYQGEELGLEDAHVPPQRQVDPGGRDGCRAPIPWMRNPPHGWASGDTWLPWPPNVSAHSAEAQRADPGSILHLYQRILAVRRTSPALRLGSWNPLESPEQVLAFERRYGDDHRVVLVNFADTIIHMDLAEDWFVEISSDGGGEASIFTGTIEPAQALILRPDKTPTRN